MAPYHSRQNLKRFSATDAVYLKIGAIDGYYLEDACQS
jgi:hypothetical protein